MKKLLALFSTIVALPVSAATLFVQWTDPVAPSTAYVPGYTAEYRVNGGAAQVIAGLTVPTINATITAVAGNTVEVRYKAINNVVPGYPIDPDLWSVWYPATQAVTPGVQPAPAFTVFAY